MLIDITQMWHGFSSHFLNITVVDVSRPSKLMGLEDTKVKPGYDHAARFIEVFIAPSRISAALRIDSTRRVAFV
jgi:hypothetical protein